MLHYSSPAQKSNREAVARRFPEALPCTFGWQTLREPEPSASSATVERFSLSLWERAGVRVKSQYSLPQHQATPGTVQPRESLRQSRGISGDSGPPIFTLTTRLAGLPSRPFVEPRLFPVDPDQSRPGPSKFWTISAWRRHRGKPRRRHWHGGLNFRLARRNAKEFPPKLGPRNNLVC